MQTCCLFHRPPHSCSAERERSGGSPKSSGCGESKIMTGIGREVKPLIAHLFPAPAPVRRRADLARGELCCIFEASSQDTRPNPFHPCEAMIRLPTPLSIKNHFRHALWLSLAPGGSRPQRAEFAVPNSGSPYSDLKPLAVGDIVHVPTGSAGEPGPDAQYGGRLPCHLRRRNPRQSGSTPDLSWKSSEGLAEKGQHRRRHGDVPGVGAARSGPLASGRAFR